MKYLAAVMAVFMMVGGAFAADAKAPNLKITKITGTVNLMKDGLVVMTLKPGDAIPQLVEPSMSFVVVDGSIEVESAGQTITGTAGSNFTVTANKNKVNVVTAAGTPVQVKTATGQSVVVAPGSEVKIETSKKTEQVSVQKGSVSMTSASGGEARTINAGEKAEVAVVAPAAPVAAQTEKPAPVEETPAVTEPVVIPAMDVTSSVIPTQEVTESNEVSPSNP